MRKRQQPLPPSVNIGTVAPGTTELAKDSPHNFARLGREFLEAAKVVSTHNGNAPTWPAFFLAFQAFELYLKSFLRAQGKTEKELRDRNVFCHDLHLGFDLAKKHGLKLRPTLASALEFYIQSLGEAYRDRDFQYSSTGEF